MKNIHLITLLLSGLLFASCSDGSVDNIDPYSPNYTAPVITGIYITGETDPTPIGRWGTPGDYRSSFQDKEALAQLDGIIKMSLPFPNPTAYVSQLSLVVGREGKVKMYIVPGRPDDQGKPGSSFTAGGYFAPAAAGSAIKLITDKDMRPGYYTITWDLTDDNNNPVPAGFYRVYICASGNLLWQDVYVARDRSDLPEGMYAGGL